MFQNLRVATTLEHASNARLLHQCKAGGVERRLAGTFPASIQGAQGFGFSEAEQHQVLWAIRDYYRKTGHPVPELIKPAFANLPERPPASCELKAMQEKNP